MYLYHNKYPNAGYYGYQSCLTQTGKTANIFGKTAITGKVRNAYFCRTKNKKECSLQKLVIKYSQ